MGWVATTTAATLLDITLEPSRQSVTSLLRTFWAEVQQSNRLDLLQRYAELRPTLRTVRSPQAIRREHNAKRLTRQWRGKPCFVCAELASQEHHIIQVKHGGTNRRDNKVWICTPCHRQVHPHMAEPPKAAPVGIVPYMPNTERRGQCPACQQPVVFVQPVFRKGRYPIQLSRRPIPLQAEAQPPYHTTDLHRPVCLNKSGYSRMMQGELGRMASRDVRWAEQGRG